MTSSAKKGDQDPAAAGRRPAGARSKNPGLDRAIQDQIGDKLRMLYGELAEEPVPDRLVAILAKLGTTDGQT